MNEQKIKGAIDQTVGSAKQHIGHMTGSTKTEMKGAAQQVKGKIETAVGQVKDNLKHPAPPPESQS
jgi:uncharacterized protein YjbJ (UPF0337 family)